MKTITCNICGNTLDKYERFKIRVTSHFIDVKDFTAHCCPDCFDKFCDLLSGVVDNEDDQDAGNS